MTMKNETHIEGYIRKEEVARRLTVTPRTVEMWAKQGILPYLKLGRGKRATVLYKWVDIEAHLKAKFGKEGAK